MSNERNEIKMFKIVYPYIPSMYKNVEKWLERKSIDGLELVNYKGWNFYFKKSKPQARKYFMCTFFDTSKNISSDFYSAKVRNKKSKSAINKLNSDIFEVDELKIDDDFYLYINLRNKYYQAHYVQFAIFSIIFLLLSFVFQKVHLLFCIYGGFWSVLLIYSLLSLIISNKN